MFKQAAEWNTDRHVGLKGLFFLDGANPMRFFLPFVVVVSMTTSYAAFAQNANQASPGTDTTTGSSNNAVNANGNTGSSVNASGTATLVPASALEKGANSFTGGQAKSRLEGAGFNEVSDLTKDDQGIWRGTAMRDGKKVQVGFDYKGNISAQ